MVGCLAINRWEKTMDLILIILILVLLFGGGFGYRRYGYGGGIGIGDRYESERLPSNHVRSIAAR